MVAWVLFVEMDLKRWNYTPPIAPPRVRESPPVRSDYMQHSPANRPPTCPPIAPPVNR